MNNPNMQQQQQQNGMAAARASAGIHPFVAHYRNSLQQQTQGWQQSITPEERGQLALQFFTQYRLLKPDGSEVDAMRLSIQFETQQFTAAQSKEQYHMNIKQKLMQITSARQQRMQGMANPLNAMNPAQMNIMGQTGQTGMRQGAPQQFPPAFPNPQLQRPMQISPVPMSQGQSSMGVNGANPANLTQGQPNQQQNMQQARTQEEQVIINAFAKKLMESCKEEVRQKFQSDVQSWSNERKQHLISQGVNPLFYRFRQHAEMMFRSGRLNTAQLRGNNQNGAQMQQTAQPNQMQNQQMSMNQRQPNQNFDFDALTTQQIEAIRVQDQGQTVVPASNNPNGAQLIGFPGQNAQSGQPQNAAMAQRQAAQAFQNNLQRQHAHQVQQAHRAQLERQQQQQQQQQAAQARNQNQLLQGQIGGLNLPQGPQQSPAMPMLNRPMAPPGQPVPPTTPQQPPQAHVPRMTPGPGGQPDPQLTALMREAQQRAAAVSQSNQPPLTEQVRMRMMPAEWDPTFKEQLLKVPESRFRQVLQSYMNDLRQGNALQNGAFPGGQPIPGQLNMPFNPQQALQSSMSGQMLNNPNIPNMNRPGMNIGQQMPGAMGGQQLSGAQRASMLPQQRFAQAALMLRQNPGIINQTDNRPFPPHIVGPQIRQNMPQDVKTWFQLKQWAAQNPALLGNVEPSRLPLLQVLHFQDSLRQQQGGMPGGQPLQQNNVAGIAPPAPMTPNPGMVRTPQQQLNIANLPPIQVTPQELQIFRQRLPPQQSNITDDQLRAFILREKTKGRLQLQQQQQQQLLAQQAQQRGQMPQQQPQQQQQSQQPPMQAQQSQANRPPTAQSQVAQVTPQQKPAAKAQQPQPSAQSNLPNNAGNKGVKRPNEDTAENSAENSNATVQAPAMMPSKSQLGLNSTQEQMSKLTPGQQEQMRAQPNAANNRMQQQRVQLSPEELKARMADPARISKYNAMVNEVERAIPIGQPVALPPQMRAQLQSAVQQQLPRLKKVEQALRIFSSQYDGAESESVARQIIKAKCCLFRQINMADGTLRDPVTITTDEFRNYTATIVRFVSKVTSTMAQQHNPNAGAQQASQQAQTSSPAQLNAANLKIVDQQQRQQKAPQAPTTDRPPFPLGGQSPRGAPTYFEGAPTVTNLVLPDKKRAKMDPGSQTSTPGPKASPRISSGKGNSPELKRQSMPERQAPQKPMFMCNNVDCDAARGFDTQVELEAHVSQAHAKIENPLKFALDSMADFLDVDQKTGEPRVNPNAAKRASKAAPTIPRAAVQPIKSDHTPSVLQNAATPAGNQAATPMARAPTQMGVKTSPSMNLLKTPQTTAKVGTPSTGAHAKATPSTVAKQAIKESGLNAVPGPEQEEEEQQQQQPLIPMSLFDYSYEDTFAAFDANGPFTVMDLKDEDNTWAIRSRPTTPDLSSKDTPSTRQDDISENENLMVNIDMDMPDAWVYGNSMQLGEDHRLLGTMLPPMDSDEMMLFPAMMDFDVFEKSMEGLGAGVVGVSVA